MSFAQYLKDTQAELRHVAWPTQTQTIVYTLFVVGISVGVSLYLGFFDFLFTSSLKRIVENKGTVAPAAQEQATSTPAPVQLSTSTPGL